MARERRVYDALWTCGLGCPHIYTGPSQCRTEQGQEEEKGEARSIYTPASGANVQGGEGVEEAEVSPAAQQREQQVLRS